MKSQTFNRPIALMLIGLLLSQCSAVEGTFFPGSNGNDNSANPESTQSGATNNQFDSELVGDHITEIDLSDGEISEIDFDLAAGDEGVLMIVSHSPYSVARGFQVSASENATTNFSFNSEDTHSNEEVHEALRLAESQFVDMDTVAVNSSISGSAFSAGNAPLEKRFKVVTNFSNTSEYDTVLGENVYAGDHIHVYIDNNDLDDMSNNDLAEILDIFEEFDQDIVVKEHQLFGYPSDIDNNGVVDVLITRKVNNFYQTMRAFVTGYFFGGDLYPTSANPSSNEGEVIFLLAPDPNGSHGSVVSDTIYFDNILRGVIAHEYEHAISYNEKINVADTSAEHPWLNEVLAHLAEDLWNDMESTGIENLSRIQTYLTSPQSYSLTSGTSLPERGGGYLFMRYLFEKAEQGFFPQARDGQDFIRNLMTSDLVGLENLKQALFGNPQDQENWADTVALFGMAMYFSDTDLSDGDLYEFEGLNLRAIQEDNRGTFFNGPGLMTMDTAQITGALKGTSVAFIRLDSESLQHLDSLSLSFQNPNDFSAYLIE